MAKVNLNLSNLSVPEMSARARSNAAARANPFNFPSAASLTHEALATKSLTVISGPVSGARYWFALPQR